MAQKIQDRLLAEFEQLAGRAGLFLYTVEAAGEWLIVDESDGIDTRLCIKHAFEVDGVEFTLSGQAVTAARAEFFIERGLFRSAAVGARRVVIRTEYHDGDRLRELFGVVRDLLKPFALQPLSSDPQQVRLRMEPKGVQDVVRGREAGQS